MATIVTIQATDLITNSRADINTNFANLNSDKIETSVLDTDTALTANSDSKIATQKAVKAYIDAGANTATLTHFVNSPICPTGASRTINIASNTTAYFWNFILPFSITVNYLSFSAFSGGATDTTFDIAIYSNDGQTKYFEITTATSGAGGALETSVSSVLLPSGSYYIAMVPNTNLSTDGFYTTDMIENAWSNLNGYDLTSQPKLSGTKTVTAGTLPTTFNPVSDLTEIGATSGGWLPFRLDN